ncbi:MAG: homoserine kinase [Candidatus Promineifilaceae bacterium]
MPDVTISIPATSANLGPGYDALGIALNLRHRVTFTRLPSPEIRITAAGEDAHCIPRDASNLVYRSMCLVFDKVGGAPPGLFIHQQNEIPIASGLGSSSSAVLAGMFGANELAGRPLSRAEILQMATNLEGHPDNVAPAVYGGLVLGVQHEGALLVEQIPVPPLKVVIVLPNFALATDDARAVLPRELSMADAIFNSSRLGLLIRALEAGDHARLAVAMDDRLHQPYRVPLISGMAAAMAAARDAGASGVALSGAGPSLIAFAPGGHDAVAAAAAQAFAEAGLGVRSWLLDIDYEGVQIT